MFKLSFAVFLTFLLVISAAAQPSSQPTVWASKPDAAVFEKIVNDRLTDGQKSIDQLVAVKGPRTIDNTLAPYDEAIRQIVSVGGNLKQIALLDNFCWGNPDKPDRLGGLVRAAEGCYKAAVAFGTPFISGKDSLYNEYTEGGQSIAIPGTILISAIGIIDDVNRCVTMDLKKPGNALYIVGETYDELGGSIYGEINGTLGDVVPKVNFTKAVGAFNALSLAIHKGCPTRCCSRRPRSGACSRLHEGAARRSPRAIVSPQGPVQEFGQ